MNFQMQIYLCFSYSKAFIHRLIQDQKNSVPTLVMKTQGAHRENILIWLIELLKQEGRTIIQSTNQWTLF